MWDDRLDKIVKDLCKKHNVSEFLVKDSIEHVFKSTKDTLQLPSMPKILIHNFGTFKPNIHFINKRLTWVKKRYEENKISEEDYQENVNYLENVLNRIKKENGKE
jgi:nucleoid DNA-binding protein